jgi:hypothetical protein
MSCPLKFTPDCSPTYWRHAGREIAATLHEWSIPLSKILTDVTDNGSNMIKAIKCVKTAATALMQTTGGGEAESSSLLQENSEAESGSDSDVDVSYDDGDDDEAQGNSELESASQNEEEFEDDDMAMPESVGVKRMPCLAHTLQLVLKAIDNIKSYCSVILKARNLVKTIRKSSVATQKLLEKCGLTLVTDCSTQWNSCYLMIERLLATRVHVKEAMDEMKSDMPLLHNDWDRLELLAKILKPVKNQTDYMQADTIALSNIIPCLLELNLTFKDAAQDKTLATALCQALRKRFACFLDPESSGYDPLPSAACLLDPTVAVYMFRDDTATLLTEAKNYIKNLVSELNSTYAEDDS